MTRKLSNNFLLNDRFIRTNEEFHPKVELHNRARTDWIGNGKTFSELYKPNSFYRQNIKRKDYRGNGYMIDQDIKWDIKHGWIKKIWKIYVRSIKLSQFGIDKGFYQEG